MSIFLGLFAKQRYLRICVKQVLPRTNSQYVQLRLVGFIRGRRHFRVVKQAVAILIQERHIDGASVAGAASRVPQNPLGFDEVFGRQQRPGDEVASCNQQNYADDTCVFVYGI